MDYPSSTITSSRIPTEGHPISFTSNAKTNDANINDFLYSGEEAASDSIYSLPGDPGSGTGNMRQPMNRPESASQSGISLSNA